MRESLGVAVSEGNLDCQEREEAALKIASLAFASDLARYLWHVKYANDPSCYPLAARELKIRLSKKFGARIAKDAAQRAIFEWVHDKCKHCLGVGEIVEANLRIRCDICDSTGLRKHVSTGFRHLEKALKLARNIIGTLDGQTSKIARFQLEKT